MKRMQHNDSVKRRRSSPIKTAAAGYYVNDTAVKSGAAFPVSLSSEPTSEIPRSISHDPYVTGIGQQQQQPMSTSVSRTPSGNSAFVQNSDGKIQQNRVSVYDETGEQQSERAPSTEMKWNSSPQRRPTPRKSDDGGEDGNAYGSRSSLTAAAGARDSTVHLKHGGHAEVVLDGGKPPSSTTVLSEKAFDVEDQTLVETVRTQGPGVDDDIDGGGGCCGGTESGGGRGAVDDAVDRVHGGWIKCVEATQIFVHGFIERNRSLIIYVFLAALIAVYYAYLAFAVWYYHYHETEGGIIPIVVFTALVMVILLIRFIGRRYGGCIDAVICGPFRHPRMTRLCRYLKW
jgi:hypothetical protein